MAAPMVKTQAKTVRGKSKGQVTVKNVLFSPYTAEWPMVPVGETPKILEEIQRTFEPYRVLPNSKKVKMGKKWSEKKWTPDSLKRVDEAKKLKAKLRCHIVFGVNATTKCLEKDELHLVIVCRSAKPPLLTSHLIKLAGCRGVPALALSGLSETLSKMMKARAIIAVGFKKHTKETPIELSKLADYIKKRAPPIELPWLQYKDVSLEELRQKEKEVSHQRQTESERNNSSVTNTSKAPSSKETKSHIFFESSKSSDGQRTVLGKRKSDSVDKYDSKTEDSEQNPNPAKKPKTEEQVKKKTLTYVGDKDRSKVNAEDEVGSKAKVQARKYKKSVSKVSHQTGKVFPIRGVPKDAKTEWKKRNMRKNQKKH